VEQRQWFTREQYMKGFDLRATAAGLEPDPEIPAAVREGQRADGLDLGPARPQPLEAAAPAAASHIVTLGCDLGPRAPAGVPVVRWDDVPAVSDGFSRPRAAILARVGEFLGAHPGPRP
jgi:hypothetical protein